MIKECVNLEYNKKNCACTYEPCEKKGKCCECIRYHLKMNQLPGCVFTKEAERSYDRSFEKFVNERK